MLISTAAAAGTASGAGSVTGTCTFSTLAHVHVCRLVLGDRAVCFAVFTQLEFEGSESLHVHLHFYRLLPCLSPPAATSMMSVKKYCRRV